MSNENKQSEYAVAENGNRYYFLEWDRKTRTWFVLSTVFTSNHYATHEAAQLAADKMNRKGKSE